MSIGPYNSGIRTQSNTTEHGITNKSEKTYKKLKNINDNINELKIKSSIGTVNRETIINETNKIDNFLKNNFKNLVSLDMRNEKSYDMLMSIKENLIDFNEEQQNENEYIIDKLVYKINNLAKLVNPEKSRIDSLPHEIQIKVYTNLPNSTDKEIEASSKFLMHLISLNPDSGLYKEAFCKWVNNNKIPLSKISTSVIDLIKNKTISQLTFLDLKDCKNVSNTDIFHIIEILPHVQHLGLGATSGELREFKLLKLPESLQSLEFNHCRLKEFPKLPENLKSIEFHQCSLTTAPILPEKLETFILVKSSRIFPEFPEGLQVLKLQNLELASLPNIPKNLREFSCKNCRDISELLKLPESLKKLNCSGCSHLVGSLVLPENLEELDCSFCTKLIGLKLPSSLLVLKSSYCHELELPDTLPEKLQVLDCSSSCLENLPNELPSSLKFFDCSRNKKLISLPLLPEGLKELDYSNCGLLTLPKIPKHCRAYF